VEKSRIKLDFPNQREGERSKRGIVVKPSSGHTRPHSMHNTRSMSRLCCRTEVASMLMTDALMLAEYVYPISYFSPTFIGWTREIARANHDMFPGIKSHGK
jgi:hypothetical protein